MGVVLSGLNLGQVVETELVIGSSGISVPGFEHADYILGSMLPPVKA